MRDVTRPANDHGRGVKRPTLPPVTHVWVGARLQRVDALTLPEARGVIERLCDELDAARDALELIKRKRKDH